MKSTTNKLLSAGVIVIVWTVVWALLATSEVMRVIGLCIVGISVFVYAAYIASPYFKKDTAFMKYFNIANIAFVAMFFALLLYCCLLYII